MRRPFKPVRTVTDPTGETWELYVSRVALPAWKQGGYNSLLDEPAMGGGWGRDSVLELPFALIGFLWSSILVPFLRLLFLTPFAVVKGRRSQSARIQAMCFSGFDRETRTWTTTIDQVDSVLEEIALGLQQGKVVQPTGAIYSGEQDD